MQVYTDGCCNKNGSGWAIICPDRKLIIRGDLPLGSTNQQAELAAIVQSLHHFGPDIHIFTDSKYAIGCFTSWLPRWKKNGWVNSKRQPVKNRQLIQLGTDLGAENALFTHVKAHAGIHYNEMADYYSKYDNKRGLDVEWNLVG